MRPILVVKPAAALLIPLFLAGCGETPNPRVPAAAGGDGATIDLVESAPVETTLDHPDVPNAAEVWVAMIDSATRAIDFAEFYASDADEKNVASSALPPVIAAIDRAVRRGVRVRFLVDSIFVKTYPTTLEQLKASGVTVRIIDFGKRGGGVHHAKYFVVDGVDAFVGSQNFDWRSLAHIQEIGVRVRSPAIAGALLDVLDTDWELAAGGKSEARSNHHPVVSVTATTGETISLVASPKGFLPDEFAWELPKIVAMLDSSMLGIDLQVLHYRTTERDGTPFHTLDEALRRAAHRGVHVRVLVSEWSSKPGSDHRAALESLAKVPNIEVRVIVIPHFSGGEIPFARVAHAKYLVVDAKQAWVGTSNWRATTSRRAAMSPSSPKAANCRSAWTASSRAAGRAATRSRSRRSGTRRSASRGAGGAPPRHRARRSGRASRGEAVRA